MSSSLVLLVATLNLSYILDRYFIKQPRLRRFVTSLFESDRDLDVELAGATLRINSRREHGYLRASKMLSKSSALRDELPVLMNLFSILRDGDTFIDVGANTGLFTHSIARLTHIFPALRLVAIEAHPDTFARLSSKVIERVTYLNFAMSDKAGKMEFVDGAVSHVFTALEKKNSYNIAGETIMVDAKPIDELDLGSDSIVLKIDVEGQESSVLRGAKRLLSSGAIRAVYLDGYDDPSIIEQLHGYGFNLFEGRTLKPLQPQEQPFSLLALRDCRIKR
jgi:FkbM family methyltransferase